MTSEINRRTNPEQMNIVKLFMTELSLNLYSELAKQQDCEDKDPKFLLHFELRLWIMLFCPHLSRMKLLQLLVCDSLM